MPTLTKQTVSWVPEDDRTYTLTLTGKELFTLLAQGMRGTRTEAP